MILKKFSCMHDAKVIIHFAVVTSWQLQWTVTKRHLFASSHIAICAQLFSLLTVPQTKRFQTNKIFFGTSRWQCNEFAKWQNVWGNMNCHLCCDSCWTSHQSCLHQIVDSSHNSTSKTSSWNQNLSLENPSVQWICCIAPFTEKTRLNHHFHWGCAFNCDLSWPFFLWTNHIWNAQSHTIDNVTISTILLSNTVGCVTWNWGFCCPNESLSECAKFKPSRIPWWIAFLWSVPHSHAWELWTCDEWFHSWCSSNEAHCLHFLFQKFQLKSAGHAAAKKPTHFVAFVMLNCDGH